MGYTVLVKKVGRRCQRYGYYATLDVVVFMKTSVLHLWDSLFTGHHQWCKQDDKAQDQDHENQDQNQNVKTHDQERPRPQQLTLYNAVASDGYISKCSMACRSSLQL